MVDDDDTVCELMRVFLAKEGFDVVTSRNGRDALELARNLQPSVITLDVLMPPPDGWDVLAEIKADDVLADTPVIMLTMLDEANKGDQPSLLMQEKNFTWPFPLGFLNTLKDQVRTLPIAKCRGITLKHGKIT